MTRHTLKKALIAASALTVLAAAPSAMAATEKPISVKSKAVKAKTLQKVTKLAERQSRARINTRTNNRIRNRSRLNRNISNRNRRGIRRNLNRRSTFSNTRFNSPLLRTSSLFNSRRGFYSPYRSSLGISFNLGSPGYSRYRWSQSPYSLFRPTYGSYGAYQTRTVCNRVTLDGLHYGRPALISVKKCSNPWDGTYIIQGSERLLTSRW